MALLTGPYGYPYPPPSDPVRDGAAAIKALSDMLRPNGVMVAGQPPIVGSSSFDPTKVRIGMYNMNIATDSSGVASVGNPFPTVLLGVWVQQVYSFTQSMAHFTYAGGGASNISVLCRNPVTGAGMPSQYFSVCIIVFGY
jgi:hypothetical protein